MKRQYVVVIGERESREVILQKFLDIYGFTFQEAGTAWLAFLEAGDGGTGRPMAR